MSLNPLIALSDIRAESPCREGWEKLLTGLGYTGGRYDPDRRVSLGDIATTSGVADAIWAVRALDWSDLPTRRAVISGVILPAAKRAGERSKDGRVAACLRALDDWCAGNESVDLAAEARSAAARSAEAGAAAAEAAARLEAAEARSAAAEAAEAWAAADADEWAAEVAARSGSAAAAEAAAAEAERDQQKADIISAFPPVALLTRASIAPI